MRHHYIIIKGELTLRPITRDDIEQIRKWRNQDEVRRWFINKQEITPEEQKRWFEAYEKVAGDLMFAILWGKDFIGTASLYHIDEAQKSVEFGRLMIGDSLLKGLGIGKKATHELCQFAFNDLGLTHIYLSVLKENYKALKLYEEIGFKKEESLEEGETYKLYLDYNYAKN